MKRQLVIGFVLGVIVACAVAVFVNRERYAALRDQIDLLQAVHDHQAAVIDSMQVSGMAGWMRDLLARAADEVQRASAGVLSTSTIDQIAELSAALKPYRQWDGDSVSQQLLSPERGQLLKLLLRMPLDSASQSEICRRVSFAHAAVADANLAGTSLRYIDLRGADLRDAQMTGADLRDADLRGATLWGADLSRADLRYADLRRAAGRWADFTQARLQLAGMDGIYLNNAMMKNADLSEAHIQWADLRGAFFNGANLECADLKGTLLRRANCDQANLTETNLNAADLRDVSLVSTTMQSASFLGFRPINLHGTQVSGMGWIDSLHHWQVAGAEEVKERYRVVIDGLRPSVYRLEVVD